MWYNKLTYKVWGYIHVYVYIYIMIGIYLTYKVIDIMPPFILLLNPPLKGLS